MNENSSRMWDKQISEPSRWYFRFDAYYRPMGPERSLLAAYRSQRLERLKEDDELRRKNRERRIALLNAVMARASDALVKLKSDEAKWSDVIAAIRLAVQELRHEYGDDVTTVKVEAAEAAPEWMMVMSRMDSEQLDKVISNLEMVGNHE